MQREQFRLQDLTEEIGKQVALLTVNTSEVIGGTLVKVTNDCYYIEQTYTHPDQTFLFRVWKQHVVAIKVLL